MRIVFWGTPDFAVPSLSALLGEGHDVVGVVTQPDRPAGRGRELRASPVKRIALDEGIPVLQPDRARGREFLSQLGDLAPELSVVIAYGQILRAEVLQLPARGSVNVHASLLPALRGAAPINWSIMNGDDRTGITVMRMVEKLDAGPILFQVAEPLGPEETANDLRLRLSEVAAEALIEALALLELGELNERPQDDARATFAPKLTRDVARVNWAQPAVKVSAQIRGLDSIPGAWTTLGGEEIKVYRPLVEDDPASGEPGTVLRVEAGDPAQGLQIACGTGALWIREVKPAGKRRMTTADWLRGRRVEPGERFA